MEYGICWYKLHEAARRTYKIWLMRRIEPDVTAIGTDWYLVLTSGYLANAGQVSRNVWMCSAMKQKHRGSPRDIRERSSDTAESSPLIAFASLNYFSGVNFLPKADKIYQDIPVDTSRLASSFWKPSGTTIAQRSALIRRIPPADKTFLLSLRVSHSSLVLLLTEWAIISVDNTITSYSSSPSLYRTQFHPSLHLCLGNIPIHPPTIPNSLTHYSKMRLISLLATTLLAVLVSVAASPVLHNKPSVLGVKSSRIQKPGVNKPAQQAKPVLRNQAERQEAVVALGVGQKAYPWIDGTNKAIEVTTQYSRNRGSYDHLFLYLDLELLSVFYSHREKVAAVITNTKQLRMDSTPWPVNNDKTHVHAALMQLKPYSPRLQYFKVLYSIDETMNKLKPPKSNASTSADLVNLLN
ncbi:hypothetical protein F5878DRAFT_643209 [Lentinula raphanica]|uniref:Uncharacterized protein n=1 Tax=Lentinula raphanica TaxID=153919 RepID=A0AA38P5U5_9AGAR|nr:hypothetical protein F5878DRAFT_643209 [Lentinula raphanica]